MDSHIRSAGALNKTVIIAVALLAWTAPAYAYLDPTTGSILLQGLLAGVAGVMVVGRLYWTKLKTFFRKLAGRT
jgi:hypothetical protein